MDFSSILGIAGNSVWTIAFFIVALGVIIFVHEYGHYIIGRLSGIHAEVFSLGFGPVIWSGTDRRGTRWQLAAVPLGGYVKFLGDSNAASAKDDAAMAGLSAEEKRHSMHGAPLWARSATVAAGPVFNFILTLVIFTGMGLYTGVATDPPTVARVIDLPAADQQLQPGDRLLALEGKPLPDWEALAAVTKTLEPAPSFTYRIERAGVEMEVESLHPLPAVVSGVTLKSAAFDAGLQEGDIILKAGGKDVSTLNELPPIVEASGGAPVALTLWRKGEILELSLTPRRVDTPKEGGGFETRWLIGVSSGLLFEPEIRTPGPIEALNLAVSRSWDVAVMSLSGLWHMVTGQISTCAVSGPIGMAQVMGQAAQLGLGTFLTMLAVMSLGIGLLNLFPIPVLDGGHLMFHAYEAVFRRPPNERVMGVLMTLGLAVVLSFMIFAIGNDLTC